MSGLRHDLVHALRQLRRQPVFAGVAILTLALAIGANTAIFSVVDAVLLKTLPVKEPEQLVLFQWTSGPGPDIGYLTGEWWQDPASRRLTASSLSHAAFEDLRDHNRTLSDLIACADARRLPVHIDGATEMAGLHLVSGGYFRGLGIHAAPGRAIGPEDDRAGAESVAVISHRFWQRRFGGDPRAIGTRGTIQDRPFTIVGVAPRGFTGTLQVGSAPDILLPIAAPHGVARVVPLSDPKAHWLQVLGRLKPGVSQAEAEAELAPRFAAVTMAGTSSHADRLQLRLVPGSRGLTRARQEQQDPLLLLFGAAAVVLLIACANVAGLLLARGTARRKETGIRLSLGASRSRLVRQWLVESAFLASIGGLFGLTLASWTKDLLAARLMPGGPPPAALDARLLGFLLATCVAAAVVFGLVPALRATRVDLNEDLKEGRPAAASGRRRLGIGRTLVVAQVALSIVLLVGAGLFLRTLRNLTRVDLGFETAHVHLFKAELERTSGDEAAFLEKCRHLLDRIRAVPGVRSASLSRHHVIGDSASRTWLDLHDAGPPAGERRSTHVNWIGGDFFETLGIRIARGRAIGPGDDAHTPPVGVINEAFARRYLPGVDPVGRRVNGREIVGVAQDSKYEDIRDPAPPTLFVPIFQEAGSNGSLRFQVRTGAAPETLAAVRDALRATAPTVALYDFRSASGQMERALSREHLFAGLTTFFGALALLLAGLGLYGLMAYAVGRRTREIGVRMALGARPADVLRLTIGEGMRLAWLGTLAGLAGSVALTRLMAGVLYGVTALDPFTFAAVTGVLAGTAWLASWLPARRAARVEPMVALRHES
jgi:predicted permease